MSIKYQDLGLVKKQEFSELEINGKKINIKKYLEVDKKSALINLAVNGSLMNGYVHDILMDAYFHILIIENYTDLDFGAEGPEDVLKIFDELESNGLLNQIIESVDQKEYNSLYDALQLLKSNVNEYNRSQAGVMQLLQDITQTSNQKE